jgi:hypothetical protein
MLQAGRSLVRVQMRSLHFFLNLPNPSSRTVALGLTQFLTEISIRECFFGVERGRLVSLTTSPPSLSRLPAQCGILSISQICRTPRPATGITVTFLLLLKTV